MSEDFLRLLVESGLRGTILVAAAILLSPVVRRLPGGNGGHWLWIAALVTFLWPLPPRTALSLADSLRLLRGSPTQTSTNFETVPTPVVAVRVMEGGAPFSSQTAEEAVTPVAVMPRSLPKPAFTMTTAGWLIGVWMGGAVFFLAQLVWRWRQTARLLDCARPVVDERWTRLLELCAPSCQVRLYATAAVRAPALAGVWKPRVLLPEDWIENLPDADLEAVLLHELGHHMRRDLCWEWLFAIARSFHWWNPAAWLAEHLSRHERELACDAWALERTRSPKAYGSALIQALKRIQTPQMPRTPGAVAMADDARPLARRLRLIARYRAGSHWSAKLAWVPAALVLGALGTKPLRQDAHAQQANDRPPNPNALADSLGSPLSSASDALTIADSLPLHMRSVQLTTMLIRVPESVAMQLGLGIAADGSGGMTRVFQATEFAQISRNLGGAFGVESLPTPRLISRSGRETSAQMTRVLRFPENWKVSQKSGKLIPGKTISQSIGLAMESLGTITSQGSASIRFRPTITRLTGYRDAAGRVTRVLAPTVPGWFESITAWKMPAGSEGQPTFFTQRGDAQLGLRTGETALVFGLADEDPDLPAEHRHGPRMINYFTLQLDILP